MPFIEPLELETWLINVLSGNPEIYMAIAFFTITLVAAYFRMTTLNMFFMLGIFILMFSGFVQSSLIVLFGIFGGLIVGYWLTRFIR